MKIKKFLSKIFPPKTMWLQSTFVIPLVKDGKKYLLILLCGKDGVWKRKTYQVEHLVDENFEVTNQTLQQEKEWFTTVI